MQQSKRKIIKTRAGELGHLDCRCLGKDQIEVAIAAMTAAIEADAQADAAAPSVAS